MKQVITALLILLYASISYAEDVLIFHQSYGNTHNKWKNRLEDAGHTVTNVTSLPSDTTSYEIIIDLRFSNALSSADQTAYNALMARGGTLLLNGEHSGFNTRNQTIASYITSTLGGGTVTYSTSVNGGNGTQYNDILSTASGTWTTPAAGVITGLGRGEWIIKDANGRITGAVWYGEDFDGGSGGTEYEDGMVIVLTDINYASHSTYYTSNNQAIINIFRTKMVSTYYSNSVSISSSQSTTRTAALNADRENGCNVCITQSGANFTANIRQDGNANFIVDKDWSGPATVTGDNVTLTVRQGNVTTSGSSDENGLGLYINGDNINLTVLQGDHANDQGEHKAVVDLNGNSNVVNLEQYDGGTLSKHFAFIDVDALSNNIDISQRDNSQKTLFLDVNNNSNDIDILQKDTGTHYLDVTVGGTGTHDIDIMQQGSGNHAARVSLSGYTVDFDLNQQGSTAQSYANTYNCTNALGCTVAVTQGN